VTPALEIPNIWRAAALPVGCVLMLLFALLRLARVGGLGQIILALLVIAAIGTGLWMLKPLFAAMGNYKLIVFFVALVAAGVLAGAPIAFVFAIATFAFLAITTRTPLTVVVSRMDEGMSHIILLSVPLFVFLGLLIEATGMARQMVDFLASLLGHVRGGLSYVLLGAMYLVSGISGSKAADMAAVAPVLFPEMRRRGAQPGELVALLAASGAMAASARGVAGTIAGIIYSLARHFWVGIGGKLGTIAFAGTALTVMAARLTGWNHADPAASPIDGLWLWAVFGVAIVAAIVTFWLSEPCKFGAVCASAVPSAILALGINLLSPAWQVKMLPLATAWFGASFAGMTSMERLAGRYWMLPLLGLIFGVLFAGSGPRVHGFGGLLGITALVSVMAALGLARWGPTNAISSAKNV